MERNFATMEVMLSASSWLEQAAHDALGPVRADDAAPEEMAGVRGDGLNRLPRSGHGAQGVRRALLNSSWMVDCGG
jgi:hypothetical protein